MRLSGMGHKLSYLFVAAAALKRSSLRTRTSHGPTDNRAIVAPTPAHQDTLRPVSATHRCGPFLSMDPDAGPQAVSHTVDRPHLQWS